MANPPKIEHPSAENVRPAMETWRILFLDSSNNIEQMKRACTDAGNDVVGATTIKAALAFLEGKNHADVIVCAAHLEQESMFEFLKNVRQSPTHRNVKFLILSLEPGVIGAKIDRSTARAGIALGADAYVLMPVFDAAELVVQIAKLQPAVPLLQQAGSSPA